MLRIFHINSKHEYKPGQRITVWSGMPNKKTQETYYIVKLVRYAKVDGIGEYRVRPVSISKDPGNLTDGYGHASKGLR